MPQILRFVVMMASLFLDESLSEPLPVPSHEKVQASAASPLRSQEVVVVGGAVGGAVGGRRLEIVHGEPLTDRKSTFQAHVANVHTVDEVRPSSGSRDLVLVGHVILVVWS